MHRRQHRHGRSSRNPQGFCTFLACKMLDRLDITVMDPELTGSDTFGIEIGPDILTEKHEAPLDMGPRLLAFLVWRHVRPQLFAMTPEDLGLLSATGVSAERKDCTPLWKIFGRQHWIDDSLSGSAIMRRIAFAAIVARAYDVLMDERRAYDSSDVYDDRAA